MDDVILSKVASIERCLKRIHEEAEKDWINNFSFQDALLLNLERACQATIDCSAYIVRKKKLGIPKSSKELFDLLLEAKIIESSLAEKMKRMVGFRNLAIHEYANLDFAVVNAIISKELDSFVDFNRVVLSIKL
jgi:uncharacterized protein YutE (UPF0331/DUF86 family)